MCKGRSAPSMGDRWIRTRNALCAACVTAAVAVCHAGAPPRKACVRLAFEGEVGAGQEWKASLGQGWIFRILPIAADSYSGWDLTVDREPPAGYPDALLLATPPYNSLNEREVGTTFGLRAQDAIGWNPRSFHFLLDPQQFREAQKLFRQWIEEGSAPPQNDTPDASKRSAADRMARLLELEKLASSGELRILDARIVPGTADPQPFAQGWAMAVSRTEHQIEPVQPGHASPQGRLVWMRFALTLWLPARWKPAPGLDAASAPCPQ